MPFDLHNDLLEYLTIFGTLSAVIYFFVFFGTLVTVFIAFLGACIFLVLRVTKRVGQEDEQVPNGISEVQNRFADRIKDLKLAHHVRRVKSKQAYVRKSAVEALGNIGTDKAVDGLKQALADEESYVSTAAIKALGKIGGDKAIDALKNALINQEQIVRVKAAQERII